MKRRILILPLFLMAIGVFATLALKIVGDSNIEQESSNSSIVDIDDTDDKSTTTISIDFSGVAENSTDAVVHIKSTSLTRSNTARSQPDLFFDFFGNPFFDNQSPNQRRSERSPGRVGTGSGVIINSEGYIVTNHHVIRDADAVEVTLNDNRTYEAVIVGTDPTTDLAVLKIKESDLPKLSFADSDKVKVGQWVIAVGNPLSLNSTVTAGIVSAKGRSINILQEKYAVEDFIQTDAAINPGNSGGALVNLDGNLIGINTAIASPTGAYTGYGFAVPSNLAKKVIDDIIEFGFVQRGVLGITIRSLDGTLAKAKNIDLVRGVYVDSIMAFSAAGEAGVLSGDVIIAVNNNDVNTAQDLQGIIARYRPGDVVTLNINRDGKDMLIDVKLVDSKGNTEVGETSSVVFNQLGADFSTIDEETAQKLGIRGGVRVNNIRSGKIRRETMMKNGFIITSIDGQKIKNTEDLQKAIERKKGGVLLEGIYESIPGKHYYGFGMN